MKKTGMVAGFGAVRGAMLATSIFYMPLANAQDTLPQTPPELRDFRLDEKPATPSVTAPVIIVPDVKPAAPTAARAPRTTATPKPRTEPAQKAQAKAEATTPPPLTGATPTDTNPALVPVTPQTGTETQAEAPATQASPEAEASPGFDPSSLPWGWIAGALMLAAIGLFGLAKLRTRRMVPDMAIPEDTLHTAPDEISDDHIAPAVEEEIIPPPITVKPVKAPPVQTERPLLDVSFVPGKATISLANLTISGQLRIINQGTIPVTAMKLRAVMISASEIQDDIITAFHRDKSLHFTEELGKADAAERIGMDLELSIPLTELRSYPLGDQRLFVPIVLANVEYDWGEASAEVGHDEARLACLIGREANPPKPKMAPLRLDLGPRSFTPLGQRPVFG